MNKIAIVYWSGTGNTEIMAQKIWEGAKESGSEVELFNASEFSVEKVKEFNIIAFGCPSMGAEVLEETEFEPMFEDCKPKLGGKKIGLFGSYGWGDGEWMRNWENNAEDAGAILVCESLMINETPDSEGEKKCIDFGKALI